jgi:succinyl-CoA:(S)-malate CoA-transferase subunit A
MIDVGIYEAVFRVLEEIATAYGTTGKIREREGSGSFVAGPARALPHRRTTSGSPSPAPPTRCSSGCRWRWDSRTCRRATSTATSASGWPRDRVNAIVIEWVASLTRDEVLERCLAEEVPVGKVNSIADIFEDEQFQARENLAHVAAEGVGRRRDPRRDPAALEDAGAHHQPRPHPRQRHRRRHA